ncbi:two-component system OmpR family response regulator [Chitinophaga sp. W3I9]|uniref:response regulator transcription factor n=1 Tax=unclassified Chitinophaga TaxID=2619133 RepID=UPI003D1ECB64
MKVLIIEDEKAMAAEMQAYLEKTYCCDLAYTARQGLEKMEENQYDFILLDLGLPDKDGLLLLQEARKNCPEASYIILTARGQLEDRIKGLHMGADDYLPKPFSLPELQARMQAISRRKFGLTDSKIALGDFDIDLHQRSVFFEDQEISLSRREFDLLSYMLLHKNRPLTRMQLSEHIWGNFSDDDYDSNYIDVHIKNIRKKLSAFASVEWLQTLRHVGYKIKL